MLRDLLVNHLQLLRKHAIERLESFINRTMLQLGFERFVILGNLAFHCNTKEQEFTRQCAYFHFAVSMNTGDPVLWPLHLGSYCFESGIGAPFFWKLPFPLGAFVAAEGLASPFPLLPLLLRPPAMQQQHAKQL